MGRKSYSRVLLKLSGESLAGAQGYGIDPQTLNTIAGEIKEVVDSGVQLALAVRHRHAGGRGTVHPAPGHAPP